MKKNTIKRELNELQFPSDLRLDANQRKHVLAKAAQVADNNRKKSIIKLPFILKKACIYGCITIFSIAILLYLVPGSVKHHAPERAGNELSWHFTEGKRLVASLRTDLNNFKLKTNKSKSFYNRKVNKLNKKILRLKAASKTTHKWL